MQKGRITTDYIVKVDDASSSATGHLLPADRELSLVHTRKPSLFSRENPSLEGSLPISSPFFEYNFLLDENRPKVMIFYSDNTLTRIFGVSEINKQSENDHFYM